MCTRKRAFPKRSIKYLETGRRCTFPAACRWRVRFYGRESNTMELILAFMSGNHSIRFSLWLYISLDMDKNHAKLSIIDIILFYF